MAPLESPIILFTIWALNNTTVKIEVSNVIFYPTRITDSHDIEDATLTVVICFPE